MYDCAKRLLGAETTPRSTHRGARPVVETADSVGSECGAILVSAARTPSKAGSRASTVVRAR